MPTAAQLLATYNLTAEEAQNLVLSFLPAHWDAFVSLSNEVGITEEVLAELFGVTPAIIRDVVDDVYGLDTSVLPGSVPNPTVSAVSTAAVTEGGALVHTVELSGSTIIDMEYVASFGAPEASGTQPLSLGDLSSVAFSDGVTYTGTSVIVPAGVSSFTISLGTADDTSVEGAEGYSIGIGGRVAAGTVNDNDSAPPPQGNDTPLVPSGLSAMLPLLHLNESTGQLSTASLRAGVVAQSGGNETGYATLFDADAYVGAEDGVFTNAEVGWTLGEQPASQATIESVFYGTMVAALKAVDAAEMNQIGSFVFTNEAKLESGDEAATTQFIALLVDAFEDPAESSAFSDSDVHAAIVESTAQLVGMVQQEPSVFHALVNWAF